jgi:molybdenum-dependent DNA-binding transcriptional regulator ModE
MSKVRLDPFTDKVQRIFRILLSRERKKDLSWYRIAKDADVSYGWAYKILKNLEDSDIIKDSVVEDPRSGPNARIVDYSENIMFKIQMRY